MKYLAQTIIVFVCLFGGVLPPVKACMGEIFPSEALVSAIIAVESSGRAKAVSSAGCRGLTQLSKLAWNEVMNIPYLPNVYNAELNKTACRRYLFRLKNHYLKDRYTLERLLVSWNGGISLLRAVNYDCSKMPRESKEFVHRVMERAGAM
mgnify:FL=1